MRASIIHRLLLLSFITACSPIHEYYDIIFPQATYVEELTSDEQIVYIDYNRQSYQETKTTLLVHYRQFQFRLNIGKEIGEAVLASDYEYYCEINPKSGSQSLMIHIPSNPSTESRQLSVDIRMSKNWTKYWDIRESGEIAEWEEWNTVYRAVQFGQ